VSRATGHLHIARGADGHVSVSVPDYLEPLDEFLEGTSRSVLRLVLGHAREPGPVPWELGDDSCHLTVRADAVVVENADNGQAVTLPRAEFVALVAEFQRATL